MKVLIVEDNDTNSKLLQAVLDSEGFETRTAGDGLIALKILEREQVDCVISDALMPDMDGYRLAYRIKKDELLKHIPFIMYTSLDASKEDEELAIHLGAWKYIRKPADTKEVVKAIKELIKNADHFEAKPSQQSPSFTEQYCKLLIDKLEEKIATLEITKEQLQNANKELDAFAYSVSHDLRAPLRIINGYTTILKEDFADKLDTEGRKTISIIIHNTRRMEQLIDELLNLSHLGKVEIKKSVVDMEQQVKEVLSEQQAGGISTPTQFHLGRLDTASCDAHLIKQVWTNLISNAIKYSGLKQNPVVEIGMRYDTNKPVYYVKDNGVGFDMAYYNKLFGVFQRLHKKDEFDGTGVGLAIVQRLITRHGGKVWADAKENEGATFYFSLPKA